MARTTLALPYLSDDFEHVRLVAQIRAGLEPGRDLIVLPFHGQTLVLLRLIFWFGTLAGGMNLAWVRLAICAAHIAGAAGCAILCTRWTGSKLMGFIAGTLYAGALGFINEQIWWPSSAIFCLGAAFLILAMVAIERDSLSWAVRMLVLAFLGLNGVLIPALVLPVYCWLSGRRRAAGVLLGVILALLALAFWQQTIHHDREQISLSLRGIRTWRMADRNRALSLLQRIHNLRDSRISNHPGMVAGCVAAPDRVRVVHELPASAGFCWPFGRRPSCWPCWLAWRAPTTIPIAMVQASSISPIVITTSSFSR